MSGREQAFSREAGFSREQGFSVEDVDFDAFYRGKPPVQGFEVAFDVTPWDIEGPQPALVAVEAAGRLRSEVLDAGCGLGENALFLAARGYRVTGFDGSPIALERARERAAARGLDVEFVAAEADRLDGVEPRYSTVVDSALYHCLDAGTRSAYAAALHRVTLPAAQLHLFCFADTESPGFQMPIQVSQDDLRTHLAPHWDFRAIELTHYTTTFTPELFERHGIETFHSMGARIDFETLRTDEDGRVTIPVWYLHAVRR